MRLKRLIIVFFSVPNLKLNRSRLLPTHVFQLQPFLKKQVLWALLLKIPLLHYV